MNKLHRNFNQNSCIFIQENTFENVIWKMSAILSRPQCVKIEVPGASNKNMTESIHKYNRCCSRSQWQPWQPVLVVWVCINYHVSVTHYKRPYVAQMARNRSTLSSVLALGASNRDTAVFLSWESPYLERWSLYMYWDRSQLINWPKLDIIWINFTAWPFLFDVHVFMNLWGLN